MVDPQMAPALLTEFLKEGEKLLGRHRKLLGVAALVGGLPGTVNVISQAGEQATAFPGISPASMLDHLLQNPGMDGYGDHTLIRASSGGQHQWKTS